MSAFEYLVPTRSNLEIPSLPSPETIRKIAIIGHGAVAERQLPSHQLWLEQGVEIHAADVDPAKLDDCPKEMSRYVLPQEEERMLRAGPFDMLFVNNFPELHLITALTYATHAKLIVIQKPQDLNFPLIRTINQARGYEHFRPRTVIHDHYRNKGAIPAVLRELPTLLQRYGRFRRILFFLTEAKSVNDEWERAPSLMCGMIQDLAVHMIDIMLEYLIAASEWRHREGDDRLTRRKNCAITLMNCVKLREQNSVLGDYVETFAALDLRVIEDLEFPADHRLAQKVRHEFDVLVVVGKGLAIEQGVPEDIKATVIEFERGDDLFVTADLLTQGIQGISGADINQNHGGLNRPLMLTLPNPPPHALQGLGGLDFPQWQSFSAGQYVASIVEGAQLLTPAVEKGYPYRRPLGDLLTKLASSEHRIRPIWGNLPPLTNFQIKMPRPDPYFD